MAKQDRGRTLTPLQLIVWLLEAYFEAIFEYFYLFIFAIRYHAFFLYVDYFKLFFVFFLRARLVIFFWIGGLSVST